MTIADALMKVESRQPGANPQAIPWGAGFNLSLQTRWEEEFVSGLDA
jgi:hypothetical protein